MSLPRRTDSRLVTEWLRTVDKTSLAAVLFLIVVGIVIGQSASIPIAERKDYDTFHFVLRQAIFVIPAIGILFATSFLDVRQVRRLALTVTCIALVLTAGTLVMGREVNGASRWLDLGPVMLQPSEFLKPAVIVLVAWLLAERNRRGNIPGVTLSALLIFISVGILLMQPDVGQAALLFFVWAGVYFVAGMPVIMLSGLAFTGAAGIFFAFQQMEHVRARITAFMTDTPSGQGPTQVDMSIAAFQSGGLRGTGFGEGDIKHHLPDAHTDFIFAVIGEEFGLLFCALVIGAYAFIVLRGFARIQREDDHFVQLAATGLILLLGTQALINMAVNLELMPAKGMTLPFVSYGGSSLLAVSFTMGLLLALTRRRARIMARPKDLAPEGGVA